MNDYQSEIASLMLKKLPAPLQIVAAPHVSSMFQSEFMVSMSELVGSLAAKEGMSISDFVSSGRAAEIAAQMCGIYEPKNRSIRMDICPKCDHIQYLE